MFRSERHFLARRVVALAAPLLMSLPGCGPPAPESLTVVSWGGAWGRASSRAFHQPFTASTGIAVNVEDYNGGLAQVRAQVEAGNVYWDVVDMEAADAARACDEGLLERVDVASLPPGADGTPAERDFAEGTLSECGVGVVFYSTILAYGTTTWSENQPATVNDFFDLETWPGRRGMRRSPIANLEFALMADGVPPEEVYAALDTEEGVERAFAKLDTIKDQVVWWEAGAQPPQMLADGEVAMTTGWNGRLFNAQVVENQPFAIIWDGQILDYGQMVVVAGSENLDTAREFVAFATGPDATAEVARHIAYAPARRSAGALVSTHADLGVDMAPHMPTHPDHMRRALIRDARWWSDRGDEMNERFSAWLQR